MSYQITYTNTKNQVSDPSFPEWVSSLEPDYLNALYPELDGATPEQVLENVVEESLDPAEGFISSENTVSDDGAVSTLVELWESQAAYDASRKIANPEIDSNCNVGTITFSTTSNTVTGTGTQFNHMIFGDKIVIYNPDQPSTPGAFTVSSVTNYTSLTLQSNTEIDMTDVNNW